MILRALIAVALLFVFTPAQAKTACVIRGIGGAVVAPMKTITNKMIAKGWKVKVSEYYQGTPRGCDVAIVHSAGDVPGLNSRAKKILTIDPTWINPGCPSGSKCVNWYAPVDAFPFIICCGGYRVNGAKNIQVSGGHVSMPERVASLVVKEANR